MEELIMNRATEMDNFLKYYATIYDQNPKLEITSDTFYSAFMNYDIADEIGGNIKYLFNQWIDRFKNSNYLNVFYTTAQKRFLQFQSYKKDSLKTYKLYLSFPKDKIFEVVNIIYDFIDCNKMITASKVADLIRSDAVVLRMANKNDTEKLISFINSNQFLNENSLSTNPFIMRTGIIGYAYDDMLSFNNVLCNILSYYFNTMRSKKMLNSVSLESFIQYVRSFYQKINYDNALLNDFISQQNIDYSRFNNYADVIKNYKEVIYLIYKSILRDIPLDEYYQLVESYKNNTFNAQPQYISNIQQEILDEYITYTVKKYGLTGTIKHIEYYLEGHLNSITRDNNFRYKFNKYLSPLVVSKIIDGNIIKYINDKISLNFQSNNLKYNLFIKICTATFYKYGYTHLYNALRHALEGNYRGFTNNGDELLREKMKSTIKPIEIPYFINKYMNINHNEAINIDSFCYLISNNQPIASRHNR